MSTTTTRTSFGYGLGSLMRVGENLFGFYLIFYLTTTAEVSPALAGTIGGSALLIGALASPVIGFLSDRSTSRFGRRRPFMIAMLVPSMALLTLLFTRVDFGNATGIYYFVVAIFFALTYYGFLVPYDALGASLTVDYNQRTKIRSICTAVLYVSVLTGGTLVVLVRDALSQVIPEGGAWSLAVLLTCSLPAALFGYIAWRATRGRESIIVVPGKASDENALLSSMKIFTLRPVWAILIWGFIYFFANAITAGTTIYLGVFVVGLSEGTAATLFTLSAVVTFVAVFPANYISKVLGKRNSILVGIGVFVLGSTAMLLLGIDSYFDIALLIVFYGICNSFALSCSYAMIYDLRELTELKLGTDKSAVILGWFSLVIGASSALSAIVLGAVLQAVGFDPAAPSAGIASAIIALQTWVPASLMSISAIVLLFWNFSAGAHAAATAQIKLLGEEVLEPTK